MKVSTTYLFDRAVDQMAQGQTRLAKSQAQLASSKQVISPSDAPDQAATIERFKSMIGRQDSYETSLNMVNNRLQAEESSLTGVSNLLLRMKELTIQAANDTMNIEDKKSPRRRNEGPARSSPEFGQHPRQQRQLYFWR